MLRNLIAEVFDHTLFQFHWFWESVNWYHILWYTLCHALFIYVIHFVIYWCFFFNSWFSPVFVFHNTNGIYVRISFQGFQSIYFSPFSLYYSNWMINIHLSQLHSCFSLFLFYSLTLPIDIFVLITVYMKNNIKTTKTKDNLSWLLS